VENITPFFTLPLIFDDIFAYLNYKRQTTVMSSDKYRQVLTGVQKKTSINVVVKCKRIITV